MNSISIAATGHYRWLICALLFFATAINYIDRQVFSILAPKLQEVIGWSEVEYGYIVFAFHVAYAIGLVGVGSLMDRLGTRKGFSLAIAFWSVAAMGHALGAPLSASGSRGSLWRSAKLATFPALSKRWRSGFRKRNGHLPLASSTPVRT